MIEAYNADIMQIKGAQVIGKPLYGIFYGVELEFEINPNAKIVKDYVNSVPPEKRKSLFDEAGSKQNTALAHFICDTVYPLVRDFCIIKRDGSLANGIEIVSVPMSRDAHNTRWEQLFQNLDKHGLVVRPSCGMHVHVSREWLTTLQIGKILHFIHNPRNEPFIKMIAGRKPPEKHANISTPMRIPDVKTQSDKTPILRKRYDGFNITNSNTIEFRIFKGTNNISRFLANIDFCASMVDFTWPGNVGLGKNNLEGYLEFISDPRRRKDYPNLAKFLVSKNLIQELKSCPKNVKFKQVSVKK